MDFANEFDGSLDFNRLIAQVHIFKTSFPRMSKMDLKACYLSVKLCPGEWKNEIDLAKEKDRGEVGLNLEVTATFGQRSLLDVNALPRVRIQLKKKGNMG